jgi:hypothetical protein
VGADYLPARLLHEAGLVVLPQEIRPQEGRAWLVGRQGTRRVLRRLPAPAAVAARWHWFHVSPESSGWCFRIRTGHAHGMVHR